MNKEVFTNFVYQALEMVAVVSSLDCCLLVASLSRACSFSSMTNRFFLHDFVANRFVPGENCCDRMLANRTCMLSLE
jgi:hypothetical protein